MIDLGTDAQLVAALSGTQLINAAEIIRYTYSGWSSINISKFENMILNIFYSPASQTTPTPEQRYPLCVTFFRTKIILLIQEYFFQ